MKYTVTVGEHEFEIEVNGGTVVVDGREIAAALEGEPGQMRTLRIGSRKVSLSFSRSETGWTVHSSGDSVEVSVADERDRLLSKFGAASGSGGKDGVVKAPMPGLVLRIAATEGTPVGAGQGLLVLEAMKMENEIKAPVAGTVRTIMVTAGQAVEKGTPLVEVASEG